MCIWGKKISYKDTSWPKAITIIKCLRNNAAFVIASLFSTREFTTNADIYMYMYDVSEYNSDSK